MRTDALGMIFKVEKRLGRGDLFELVSHFSDGSKEVSVFQHEFYDGLGALLSASRQWTGDRLTLPCFRIKTKASPESIFAGLRGLREDMTPSVTLWKQLDKQKPYSPNHLAWKILSPESSQTLLQVSRAQGISLNSLVLSASNQVIAERLLATEQKQCRWLIPVNMRRTGAEQHATHNCTSSVGLRFERQASPSEVEYAYRSSLNKWRALAANALARAAVHLGEERLFQLARMRGERNSWIGSFTNLGAWNFPTINPEDHWPVAVSLAPPAGTPCFPIAIGIVTWQGHFSISLRLHAGLIGENENLPEDLLAEIITRLSEMVSTPLVTMQSSVQQTEQDHQHGETLQ